MKHDPNNGSNVPMRKYAIAKGIIAAFVFIACVWAASYLVGRYKARADAKSIMLTALPDYKEYEVQDRELQAVESERQKLQIFYNLAMSKKMEIRKRLGVPENFVEKREDDKNPQSPVIGFVERPPEPVKQ